MSTPEAVVARALSVHWPARCRGFDDWQCGCGYEYGKRKNHHAHVAAVVIEQLGLTQEWGVISSGEYEPNLVFDVQPPATSQAHWRNAHGIPAEVVSRSVTPWVAVDGSTQP